MISKKDLKNNSKKTCEKCFYFDISLKKQYMFVILMHNLRVL